MSEMLATEKNAAARSCKLQLSDSRGPLVNRKEPLRLVLDLRARSWPGAVHPKKQQQQQQQQAKFRLRKQSVYRKGVFMRQLLKAVGCEGEGEGIRGRKGQHQRDLEQRKG